MKVKLLKRLRDQAKSKFWIEYHPADNFPYSVTTYELTTQDVLARLNSKESAIKCLNLYRRRFILQHVWKKLDI